MHIAQSGIHVWAQQKMVNI